MYIHIVLFFRVDSVMLLEDGFEVVSSDASDKMLKNPTNSDFVMFENYYFYCLRNCWRFLTKIDSFCIFFCRVDSVMLLEDGFEVVSSDASDKMLKTAYKLRWDRRRETAFDNWSRCTNLFCSSQIMRPQKKPCNISTYTLQWLSFEILRQILN